MNYECHYSHSGIQKFGVEMGLWKLGTFYQDKIPRKLKIKKTGAELV
jgi:hypothetical protein